MSKFISIACGRKEIEVQKVFDDMLASPVPRTVPDAAEHMIVSPAMDMGARMLMIGVPVLAVIYLPLLMVPGLRPVHVTLAGNIIGMFSAFAALWLIGYIRKRNIKNVMRLGTVASGRVTGMARNRKFLSMRRPYIKLAIDVESGGRHYDCRALVHFLELGRIAQMADADNPMEVLFIPGCREAVVPKFYTMQAKYSNLN